MVYQQSLNKNLIAPAPEKGWKRILGGYTGGSDSRVRSFDDSISAAIRRRSQKIARDRALTSPRCPPPIRKTPAALDNPIQENYYMNTPSNQAIASQASASP